MNILALDPALHCGFAHSAGHSGVWNLADIGTGHAGLRLIRFRELLHQAHQAWGFDALAYEDASFGSPNPNVQAMHNELRGVIKLVAAEVGGKELISFVPSTLKKFATGDGRAKKPQMIAAWNRHFPTRPVTDDNEADALWVLQLAEHGAKLTSRPGVTVTKRSRKPKAAKLF